jgi:hypothetical protein
MWCCRACVDPWPCATARLLLRAEYGGDRLSLTGYLCGHLHQAMLDLYRLNPDTAPEPQAMFDRFVAWSKHRFVTDPDR